MQFLYHIMLIFICSVVAPLVMTSCSNSRLDDTVPVDIVRVEKAVATGDSTAINTSIFNLLQLTFPKLSLDSANLDKSFADIVNTPAYLAFYDKVDSVFPDNTFLCKELNFMLSAQSSPYMKAPALITYISPYNQSIILGDDYVAVALNHYLGVDEPSYSYFPEYSRKYKDKCRIAVDINEALVRRALGEHVKSQQFPSMLQSMILNGVVIKLMQLNNPDLSLSQILMWNDQELAAARKHESDLWQYLITRDLLYSTSIPDMNQFTELSPIVIPVSDMKIQFLGRFIGYNIVDKYLKSQNKNISLGTAQEILSLSPQQVLINSKYNGR